MFEQNSYIDTAAFKLENKINGVPITLVKPAATLLHQKQMVLHHAPVRGWYKLPKHRNSCL